MGHCIFGYPGFYAQSRLDRSTQLYHIYSLNRFKELLENKSVYFRKVTKWTDTFEYPIRFMREDRREVIEKSLFGLCMTKEFDKEAMWKLYSTDDHGVCIKTTASAICNALSITSQESSKIRPLAFIGEVKYVPYLTSEPSRMFYEEDKRQYPDYMYPAYLKKDAFSYEEEVRIMLLKFGIPSATNGIPIPLRDFSFIHEIILSPYYPEDDILSFRSLCKEHGLDIQIRQSEFLRKIDENSVKLPTEREVYWGAPKDAYDILSS